MGNFRILLSMHSMAHVDRYDVLRGIFMANWSFTWNPWIRWSIINEYFGVTYRLSHSVKWHWFIYKFDRHVLHCNSKYINQWIKWRVKYLDCRHQLSFTILSYFTISFHLPFVNILTVLTLIFIKLDAWVRHATMLHTKQNKWQFQLYIFVILLNRGWYLW